MKTKISLILLAMGLASASAYAGTIETAPMPVSNDINVTAPDQSDMWSFGVTALLMQPIGGGLNYANSLDSATTNGETAGDISKNGVGQNYNWWFGADITYAFPGNGRDVMVAYEGMHSSNTNSTDSAVPRFDSITGGTSAGSLASPFRYSTNTLGSYNVDGGTFTDASGKVETNYDAGDLLFGQKLDVGSRVRLHPFAGVRYAHINLQGTGNYAGTYTTATSSRSPATTYDITEVGKLNSTFNGIGPRFGSDAQVNLGQGFSVRGRLGLSALIGTRDANNSFIDSYYGTTGATAGTLVATDAQSADTDSQTRVVPEIDGRLALAYTYAFDTDMALGVEAGWQAENYFNSSINANANTANFALQGPYARLQFDVA